MQKIVFFFLLIKSDIFNNLIMMKNTNFLQQSYPQIVEITETVVCYVISKYHSQVKTKNGMNTICDEKFQIVLNGPFLIFYKLSGLVGDSKTPKKPVFYLFTPYYMVRTDFLENSIILFPSHPKIQSTTEIMFNSKSECISFANKIRKVRSLLSDSNFILPPASASVSAFSPTGNPNVNKYDFSFINNSLTLHSPIKEIDIPSVTVDNTSSICHPFDMQECPDDTKLLTFWFRSRGFSDTFIIFESFDMMSFSFLTIYIALERIHQAKNSAANKIKKVQIAQNIISRRTQQKNKVNTNTKQQQKDKKVLFNVNSQNDNNFSHSTITSFSYSPTSSLLSNEDSNDSIGQNLTQTENSFSNCYDLPFNKDKLTDKDLYWPDARYFSTQFIANTSNFNNITHKKSQNSIFQKVIVPEKASSHLELLQFEKDIKREIIVYFNEKDKIPHKNQQKLIKPFKETSFEKEIIKIKAENFQRIPFYSIRQQNTKLFQMKPDFLTKELSKNGNQLMHEFLSRDVLSNQTKEFMDYLQLKYPNSNKNQPIPGVEICIKLSHLLTKINKSAKEDLPYQLSDKNIEQIIDILSSLFVMHTIPDFFPKFSQLMKENIPNFFKFSIFISHVLYKGDIFKFLSLLNENAIDENENQLNGLSGLYQENSLLRNPEFIEILIATFYPIINKEFVGKYRGLEKPLTFKLRIDISCRNDSNLILDAFSKGKEIPNQIIADLISQISQFYSENYRKPEINPFSQMRSPFYAFQVACNLPDDTDVIALRTVVTKITKECQQNPLAHLFSYGLNCGMAGKWFLRSVQIIREESLSSEESGFYDPEVISNIADSLFSISSIFISINEEELFSYDLPFC